MSTHFCSEWQLLVRLLRLPKDRVVSRRFVLIVLGGTRCRHSDRKFNFTDRLCLLINFQIESFLPSCARQLVEPAVSMDTIV